MAPILYLAVGVVKCNIAIKYSIIYLMRICLMRTSLIPADGSPPHKPRLPAPEPRFAPLKEGSDAFLMILGQARQRELVNVHVAGEVIKRVRETIDGQLGHGDRQRRLRCHLCGQRHRSVESRARIDDLLHQAPLRRPRRH